MEKSAKAFRTIGEVANWLNTEAYVLRFWESRFSHIKPVKRKDGRRYYRPEDMTVIGGIKTLLHKDGLTIKGVQKILKEKGVKYVASLSPPIETRTSDVGQNSLNSKSSNQQDEVGEASSKPSLENTSPNDNNLDENKIEYSTKRAQNLNKEEQLNTIAKRLRSLRDKIQAENENSFNF